MSIIVTSRPRSRQPAFPGSVSSAALGPTGAFVANESGRLVDFSGRAIGAHTYSGVARSVGAAGNAMSLSGASDNGLRMPAGCASMQSQTFSRIAVIQWSGLNNSGISDSHSGTHPASQGSAEWRVESDGSLLLVASNIALVGASPPGLVSAGRACVVGVTYDGANTTFWVDGRQYSGGSVARTWVLGGIRIGSANYGVEPFAGLIYAHVDWPNVLPASAMAEFTSNPWQLFAPVRRPVFFSSSGSASATLTSQGQAATSLKAGKNISVTFSSAGQASTTLLKGSIVGKTFSIAGQAATSLLGSYSIAGGNILTVNSQAATSFKAGRIIGKTLTSQGQAATSFLKGAVVSATLTSQGQASTTLLGGLGSASATFAILGRASTNFLVPSSTRGVGVSKKKNIRKKVKKRIEEDLFFIESSFKEVKKDKPVKERLQDIVQLQESLQPIIDRLKTLLPDDKIIQVEVKEEITEFKQIMKRFDSLEQRLQDIEDLTTIILSEI